MLHVAICQLAYCWCKIWHTVVPDPCIISTSKRPTCVVERITHHNGILTWNEPSPQQWIGNAVWIFKKIFDRNWKYILCVQQDILEKLVCSYGSVRAGISDGSTSTSILYIDSSTGCWIRCNRHLCHHNCTHPNIWDRVESYAAHTSWPVSWFFICLPKIKLINFKSKVP